MMQFELNTRDLDEAMARLASVGRLHGLMPKLAAELISQTEENLETQGHGGWTAWAPATEAARKKRAPNGPGKILQLSGHLARSVVSSHDAHHAAVGVPYNEEAKNYAAIHQLGGQAGRGRKVAIPARPYLPFTEDGGIQPQAEQGLIDVAFAWLQLAL